MADYIYLLETRLSAAQRASLRIVREVAKAKNLTSFLVGGAVRDLTSGSPVRDLDVVVQGNALKLKKDIEKAGGVITGEIELGQALFARFPGGVRMEIGSTLSVTYPKPGKPVAKPANILDDLRRRDFTANAMALSLNEGSYGLLMDPLNGVADIEVRQLRLAGNYGFIEDPARMIRAARLMARLGWTLEERTQTRYETGKQEGYISALSDFARGYELEEIVHEEDPLRVLKALEAEGWMKDLAPYWTSTKANAAELDRLRDTQAQLEMQGIRADAAAAAFPLLTAKLAVKEVATLKAAFPRQGFVAEIDALEAAGKQFASQLVGKSAAKASEAWKLISAASPEAVLWTAFSSKNPTLQAKLKSFASEWPQARQRIPYQMMQEMRITPELPGYDALLESLFFELMDGNLTTPEEMKAFLEPHSPPAPPPPVNLRRRAAKKEAKSKGRGKKAVATEDFEDDDVAAEEIAAPAEGPAVAELVEAAPMLATIEPKAEPVKPAPAVKSVPARESAKATPPAPAPAKAAPVNTTPAKQPGKSGPAAAKEAAVKMPAKAAPAKKTVTPVKAPAKKAAAVKSVPAKPASKPAAQGKSAKQVPTKAAAKKSAPAKPAPKKVVVKAAAPAKTVSAKKPAAGRSAAKKAAPPAKGVRRR